MTIWNVTMPVVELVEAATADEALAKLARALDAKGFEPYHHGTIPGQEHAFESEPLPEGTEVLR